MFYHKPLTYIEYYKKLNCHMVKEEGLVPLNSSSKMCYRLRIGKI